MSRIIQDMADISSPLKQFTDAVLSQEAMARKRELVEQRGNGLKQVKINVHCEVFVNFGHYQISSDWILKERPEYNLRFCIVLFQFSGRLSKTAGIVAFANARSKQRSDSLVQLSHQVQNLTPQLLNAGTIKMNYPENKAADENFANLRKQYAAGVQVYHI